MTDQSAEIEPRAMTAPCRVQMIRDDDLVACGQPGEWWTSPSGRTFYACSDHRARLGRGEQPPQRRICRCGHPESHHDAGECWTDEQGRETYGETSCPCSWLEVSDGR